MRRTEQRLPERLTRTRQLPVVGRRQVAQSRWLAPRAVRQAPWKLGMPHQLRQPTMARHAAALQRAAPPRRLERRQRVPRHRQRCQRQGCSGHVSVLSSVRASTKGRAVDTHTAAAWKGVRAQPPGGWWSVGAAAAALVDAQLSRPRPRMDVDVTTLPRTLWTVSVEPGLGLG